VALLPMATTHCTAFPPVVVSGSDLIVNDGSGQRFFAAGMVYSNPSMLSSFDSATFKKVSSQLISA
jgi:hypothetical protein